MLICGFNKTTLLDYPEHVAATVFLGGCNFRCPFCQNRDLLLNPADFAAFTEEDIFDHLKKRRSMLSGVCVSGGEPTIYKNLPDFLAQIKDLDYLIKLDTNGTNPDMLKSLYDAHLIDYVAMDIKNCKEKYALTSGISDIVYEDIIKSINIISSSNVDHEFRTTVTNELHTPEDIGKIAETIKGEKKYFLQNFTDSGDVISSEISSVSQQKLDVMLSFAKEHIPNTQIR